MFNVKTETTYFEVISESILVNAATVRYYIEDSDGNKIAAVKKVRSTWSIGLKDAKEIVEYVAAEHNIHFGGLT